MIGALAAVAVGIAFVVAGAAKVAIGPRWLAQAREFGVAPQLAQFVPWWELVVGAMLAAQIARSILAWFAVATLVVFSGMVALQLSRGRHPPCACFGAWSPRPIGARTLVRNAALIALALVAALA